MPKQRAVEKKNWTIILIIFAIVLCSMLAVSAIFIGVFVGIAVKTKKDMDNYESSLYSKNRDPFSSSFF